MNEKIIFLREMKKEYGKNKINNKIKYIIFYIIRNIISTNKSDKIINNNFILSNLSKRCYHVCRK